MQSLDQSGWADYLHSVIDAKGFGSQAGLARATGINGPVISRWLKGEQPSIENLRKLAKATDIPILELLVVSGHLEPAEARLRNKPAPPSGPRPGDNVPPDILEALDSASVEMLTGVRIILNATQSQYPLGTRQFQAQHRPDLVYTDPDTGEVSMIEVKQNRGNRVGQQQLHAARTRAPADRPVQEEAGEESQVPPDEGV